MYYQDGALLCHYLTTIGYLQAAYSSAHDTVEETFFQLTTKRHSDVQHISRAGAMRKTIAAYYEPQSPPSAKARRECCTDHW